jgi:hypothetical protein
MKAIVLKTLTLSSLFSVALATCCYTPYQSKGFTGGYDEVQVQIASDFGEDAKTVGLTKEDVERTVKLKLLSRGFKVLPKGEFSPTGSFIRI